VSLLNPIYEAVAWVLKQIYYFLSPIFGAASGWTWALSIVLLVVLMRLIMVPLFVKQMHTTRAMAALAPQMTALRKKYKNDKQTLQQETMKLYQEAGVNPLMGCLPVVLQLPLFFALFNVLRAISEWKPGQAPKYGLTIPVLVSAQKATIFGVHLDDKLLFPHTPGMGLGPSIVAAITVALSATTTFLTVRQSSKRGLMQTNVDPDNPMAATQKYMMYIVPFFSLTGLYWQYGLVLYWVTTNLWTLGQQYFMFRNWTTEDTPAAGATAAAGGTARATQSSARPASGARTGPAKTGPAKTGPAKTGTAKTGTAKTATGTVKTASGETKSDFDPRAPKAASGSARTGASNGRTGAPRAGSASSAGTGPGRPRTGSARGDAAAAGASPSGQDGAAKRGLLRLGRQKQEPVPEPEAPAAKVVRQQPVRQARSKRSGKR